ncbi:uncharacterized protein DUF4245 [Branchiibius hedensis]|uniref:DUF4245 domain-containing protein n=1 Tax=Branchiibius hedensis TaxID=672460 RepID=A0A2Y8ZRX5_9MICO|nr:DUF4245 family protein [Branchiibius hedensis]PWJ24242.1 uncharacterized protein DUF4245 [Branchiibius hedensis]SSA33059.1 Protein of unknown function [Branchiibius hedensis]
MSDTATQEQAPAPAPRRMRGGVRSMVISMIVLLAAVAVWVAMVPRVSSVSTPIADPQGIAREIGAQQKWDIAIPVGLPDGWAAQNVTLLTFEKQPATWQAGYDAPNGGYVAAFQTKDGDATWVKQQTYSGVPAGSVTIDGVTWAKYDRASKGQKSLVRSTPLSGLSTVVTGLGTWEQLQQFAGALQPISQALKTSTAS